jgi:galactokinase/mevalonate kinase-like predicted kinase
MTVVPTSPSASRPCYPFEVVVVTFPDEGAARVAAEGPLRDLEEVYPHTKFLSTCDPLGCRCGSGGGTLAALEQVVIELGGAGSIADKNILILHAGGDSSRCFTQMALGKAWTNIPLRDDQDIGDVMLGNPIQLGMDSIARIFSQSHKLEKGSIVIASSDALLSIPHYKPPAKEVALGTTGQDSHAMPDVLGVAFPAPWETAKNHGVYVLSEPPAVVDVPENARALEVPVQKVLQKPSLSTLEQEPFTRIGNMQKIEGYAWIDNGIIAFLPRAAKALRDLAQGVLHTTTKSGLLRAYEQRKATEPDLTPQNVTHKVDLYTHILQALTIKGEPGQDTSISQHREVYLKEHASALDADIAAGIFEALSPFQFQALAIPEGKFLHLGTTRELVDFYVYGCMRTKLPSSPRAGASRHEIYTQNCTFFGQELGMIRRMGAYADLKHDKTSKKACLGKDCVVMGSVLVGSSPSCIGERTVIEFCHLDGKQKTGSSIQVGNNCLLSGLRSLSPIAGDSNGAIHFLQVPDNVCVQMMPLMGEKVNATDQTFVYMALGIDDPIKNSIANSTFFGIPMKHFMRWAGLSAEDLWNNCSSKTLWNAKLHPTVMRSSGLSYMALWEWLNFLPTSDAEPLPDAAQNSLTNWKSQRRLSLSEVRDQSDATGEFRYRHDLLHSVVPAKRQEHCRRIAEILFQRRHDECGFYPLLTDTLCVDEKDKDSEYIGSQAIQALETLDDVIQKGLLQSQYDVCGRTLMVESALLDDLAKASARYNSLPKNEEVALSSAVQARCAPLLKAIQSPVSSGSDRQKAFNDLISIRGEYLAFTNGSPSMLRLVLEDFAQVLELAARMMTEICVSGFLHDNSAIGRCGRQRKPIVDKWVIATAPARVDLSGGWSDTPPVCYEYGSVVTGMAVTVDGKKPLSCRCRIVSSGRSTNEGEDDGIIFVRSEIRDSLTCELVSSADIQIRSLNDLRDARDPNAPGALIKCALICLGLIPIEKLQQEGKENETDDLQSYMNNFCLCEDGNNARLEIVVTSLLPQGSGMGTSSILGGCVLAAVGHCVGIDHSTVLKDKEYSMCNGSSTCKGIIDAVSALEQILSTGGGFQDQVNGLYGGLKIVSSKACQLPIRLDIDQIEVDPAFQKKLDESLVLAFTGKTRLAMNILQNVLRRWARRTPEVVQTVKDLVEGAHKARDALQRGDLNCLGECLNAYYSQKKHMAGEYSGVEPELVQRVIEELQQEKAICGASLCGAGGGGFLIMFASQGVEKAKIHSIVQESVLASAKDSRDSDAFSWHECHISEEGLTISVLPATGRDVTATTFDASWHCQKSL